MVVLHQGVHDDIFDTEGIPHSQASHQHENFQNVHHEHQFHIGIFHFLGHLLEGIHQSGNQADEHFVALLKTSVKNGADVKVSIPISFETLRSRIIESEVKSLRAPPYLNLLKQRLIFSNTPLRAPPALV